MMVHDATPHRMAGGGAPPQLGGHFQVFPGSQTPAPMSAEASQNMQQKMQRQRQLALENQRNAAKSRLGANIVAQANPLVPTAAPMSTLQGVPNKGRLFGDPALAMTMAPLAATVASEELRRIEASNAQNPPTRQHSSKDRTGKSSSANRGMSAMVDEVEEMLDDGTGAVSTAARDAARVEVFGACLQRSDKRPDVSSRAAEPPSAGEPSRPAHGTFARATSRLSDRLGISSPPVAAPQTEAPPMAGAWGGAIGGPDRKTNNDSKGTSVETVSFIAHPDIETKRSTGMNFHRPRM